MNFSLYANHRFPQYQCLKGCIMNFTITCPNCQTSLKLFDSQIKKKEGYIRCTRCGARIKYDLNNPRLAETGFWPSREPAFKPGAQRRFLSISKAMQENPGQPFSASPVPQEAPIPRFQPAFDRSASPFQKFDLKTGQILPNKGAPVNAGPTQPGILPSPTRQPFIQAGKHTANVPKTGHHNIRPHSPAASHPVRRTLPRSQPTLIERIHHFFQNLFLRK